jgi:Tfp pilus assembly protein PilO
MTMPLLARVVREYRGTVVALAVAAALGFGAYFLVVRPLQHRLATADQRAAAASRELRQAMQQEEAARRLVSGKEQAGRDLERFYTEILPTDQSAARRVAYLRLAQLADESNLEFDRRTIGIDRERDARLARMTVSMTLSGAYADIRRFLHRIETSRDFVVISGVELARRQDENDPLQVAIEVATYFPVPDGQ